MESAFDAAGYDEDERDAVIECLHDDNLISFYEEVISKVCFLNLEEQQELVSIPADITAFSEEELDEEILEAQEQLLAMAGFKGKFVELELLERLNFSVSEVQSPSIPARGIENSKLAFEQALQRFERSCDSINGALEEIRLRFENSQSQAAVQPEFMKLFDTTIENLENALQNSDCDEFTASTQKQEQRLFGEIERLRQGIRATRIEAATLRAQTAAYESREISNIGANQFDAEILFAYNEELEEAYSKVSEDLAAAAGESTELNLDSAETELFKDETFLLTDIYNSRRSANTYFKQLQTLLENNAAKLRMEYESVVNLNVLGQLERAKVERYFEQMETVAQNIIKMRSQIAAQEQPPLELLSLNGFFERIGSDGTLESACEAVEQCQTAISRDIQAEAKALEIMHNIRSVCSGASKTVVSSIDDCVYNGYEQFGSICNALAR